MYHSPNPRLLNHLITLNPTVSLEKRYCMTAFNLHDIKLDTRIRNSLYRFATLSQQVQRYIPILFHNSNANGIIKTGTLTIL